MRRRKRGRVVGGSLFQKLETLSTLVRPQLAKWAVTDVIDTRR